ncbi:MAG: MFS transporter [Gammaproteobacteria bacterium]|nr:MFS transporter [Gammaproteobacteria bacterium]
MRPLNLYMAGTASWFVNHGIQGVMFAWLVTIVLRESPQMVGIAQMAMLLPALLFMLIGGSLADRFGGRRVAVLAQAFSVVPVLGLLAVLATDQLSFATMIGFAVLMGLAQAFVTPARDGLLNQVAEGRIQHTVVRATMIQFSAMLIAFVIVGQTDRVGPAPVIAVQALVLILGTIAMRRIPVSAPARRPSDNALWRDLSASVATGLVTVMRSAPMRMVAIQNVAIGMFFMGSYIVTIPVAVRDIYGGSAADLAMLNAANAFGLALTSFLLMRVGYIRRPRRALLLAQALGAVALGTAGFGFDFPVFAACIFLWGGCGGVAMSMARTIMQEQAPYDQRGRVMAFFSFSLMGAGPFGALLAGAIAGWWGPGNALIAAMCGMLTVLGTLAVVSRGSAEGVSDLGR